MEKGPKTLSVTQAAALCSVGRTTVGYWIRSGKLAANRCGKKYEIPVQNLLYFLKASGQKIPEKLEKENLDGPVFRAFQNCWHYYQNNSHGVNCSQCIVFTHKLQVCFSARNDGQLKCLVQCEKCHYYREAYFQRVQFIHQLDMPAAIVKDLYFWAGNRKMAELCDLRTKQLVGMGLEKIIHPRSLEQVISCLKRKSLGNPRTPFECRITIKNHDAEGMRISCCVLLLKEPQGAFLITAVPERNHHPVTQRPSSGKHCTEWIR
ncbi:MAG: excisionase family DNA-binding protein [Desulfobacterales bacterium]|jgi:excisionase family DNA binding protein